MNKYFLTFFTFFMLNWVAKGQAVNNDIKGESINISISHDSLRKESVIYMKVGKILTDSVILYDVDFIIDSLYQINDTLWNYMYSVGCHLPESECYVWGQQVLIQELNSKIHFSFISRFHTYTSLNDLKEMGYYQSDKYVLSLIKSDSINIYLASVKRSEMDGGWEIDSTEITVHLSYDVNKKIYYSSIEVYDGVYELILKEPKEHRMPELSDIIKIRLKNEEVFSIDIKNSHFVYLKKKWFKLTHFPDGKKWLISFSPITEEDFLR